MSGRHEFCTMAGMIEQANVFQFHRFSVRDTRRRKITHGVHHTAVSASASSVITSPSVKSEHAAALLPTCLFNNDYSMTEPNNRTGEDYGCITGPILWDHYLRPQHRQAGAAEPGTDLDTCEYRDSDGNHAASCSPRSRAGHALQQLPWLIAHPERVIPICKFVLFDGKQPLTAPTLLENRLTKKAAHLSITKNS